MIGAILVAAGRGTRMGPGVDKLFLEIRGQPIIAYTWGALDKAPAVDEVIVVVRDGMQDAFAELARKHELTKPYQLVAGGKERQDSVWNGLEAAADRPEIVLIQDGARPCLTRELIDRSIQAARETGAAVVAERITDTIKESEDGVLIQRTLDRSRLWSVQTPQTFRTEVIRTALGAVRQRGVQVTDDTAACELIGQPVRLVQSATANPKVTSRKDLPLVELILAQAGVAS